MMYHDHEQAELECRLNERKIGGRWEPVLVDRVVTAWHGYEVTEKVWQPQNVTARNEREAHVRRTMYVR